MLRVRQGDAIVQAGDRDELHPAVDQHGLGVWSTHGHQGAQLGFQPKCSFRRAGPAVFPPTVKGDFAFQTIALRNDGDTTVGFEFPAKSGPPGLEIDEETGRRRFVPPSKGSVPPKSLTLVTFRFDATDTEPHREQMTAS